MDSHLEDKEAQPRDMVAHPGAMEAQLTSGLTPGAMEAHPGGAVAFLDPWRLTLKTWRLTQELWCLILKIWKLDPP
jgi:hypothetical protein